MQSQVRETVVRLMNELNPDGGGLSVMTFQRRTAKRIIKLIRELKPTVQVAVGVL